MTIYLSNNTFIQLTYQGSPRYCWRKGDKGDTGNGITRIVDNRNGTMSIFTNNDGERIVNLIQGPKVILVLLVLRVFRVQLVLLAHKVLPENRVLLVNVVLKVFKVQLVLLVILVHKVNRALLVQKVILVNVV